MIDSGHLESWDVMLRLISSLSLLTPVAETLYSKSPEQSMSSTPPDFSTNQPARGETRLQSVTLTVNDGIIHLVVSIVREGAYDHTQEGIVFDLRQRKCKVVFKLRWKQPGKGHLFKFCQLCYLCTVSNEFFYPTYQRRRGGQLNSWHTLGFSKG